MKYAIFYFLLLPLFGNSQVNISGNVNNNNGPIEFANVIVHDSKNQFVTGEISDKDGHFQILLREGKYNVMISHLNYESYEFSIDVKDAQKLKPIILEENSNNLDEVTVSARRTIIRREIDKTVVNIENNPIAQSSSVFDALKSVPGLVVNNNAIAMLGKSNVLIAIDGRMVELSGDELNNYLESLTASSVKEIEVITNPSARYEAEGNSGIVNIITKKSKKNSWRNNLSATHSQAKYGWQSFSNNFNYQKNKWSMLLSASYNSGSRYFRQLVEPKYTERPLLIDSNQKNIRNSFTPRVLVDYALDDNTIFSLQYQGSYSKPNTIDDLKTTIFNSDNEVTSFLIAENTRYDRTHKNSSYNIFFDKKLDTLGKRLMINLDMLDYDGNSTNQVQSEEYDADLNYLQTEFSNLGNSLYDIKNYSAKIDIDHPTHFANLSYGLKSNLSKTKYKLDNFNTISGQAVLVPSLSNAFNFDEIIHSAYFNSTKQINDKWEYQFGLRYEYTLTEGYSNESNSTDPIFTNEYGKLFPTFYTRYSMNDDHVFSFNYGRRINRPAYSQLNPSRTFLNGQSSQLGNPYLSPSFSDNIELVHIFRHNLSTTLSYTHISDAYSFIFDLNDEEQEQVITYKNIFDENIISLMTNYELSLTHWWNTRSMLFLGYTHSTTLEDVDGITLNNGSRVYTSINNYLDLNEAKSITAEINLWYDSQHNANLYRFEESWAANISLHFKSIAKGLNLTVAAFDIFNTSPRTVSSQVNGIGHDFTGFFSERNVRISLNYTFGNNEISTKERSFGNEDVRSRSN